jgi:hypothetical protein
VSQFIDCGLFPLLAQLLELAFVSYLDVEKVARDILTKIEVGIPLI